VHSQFLPNWFLRRRALAIGIAFSGVGAGAILILPWLQTLILEEGWRAACWKLGVITLVVLLPINLLVAKSPESLGLLPDGEQRTESGLAKKRPSNVVDAQWAATEWTVPLAIRTARFWWLALSFFSGGWIWYAVQVHQTKYLLELGFSGELAAYALGLVGLTGIAGQIAWGYLSDRIGREWAWTASGIGFTICYLALLALPGHPARWLVYVMVAAQGLLGYGLASVFGAIPMELFQGARYSSIFAVLNIASNLGAGLGPWVAGLVYDRTGSYVPAFWLAIACSILSVAAIWLAAPRKVRLVAGRAPR